ncbi:MAG: glycoside hydrolase family 2 [Mucilaginibacter sp.]|nr:glycoside hydrolase family 2 [Mucilaginibacter sp.]
MLKSKLIIILLACSFATAAQNIDYSLAASPVINYTQLGLDFKKPPRETRLRCYWWWLNSMVTKESITHDLEQMKAKGYGGASIVDAGSSNYTVAHKTPPGPVFMSPGWMELYKHAVKEAQRLGLELSVNVQSGWNPGGPTITPELALKKIVYAEVKVTGGKEITIKLPQPDSLLIYRDIKIQAFKKAANDTLPIESVIENWKLKTFNSSFGMRGNYPLNKLRDEYTGRPVFHGIPKESVIDITGQVQHGILKWNVPPGEWIVVRYGWTCTGARTSTNSDGWEGLSLDHLNPDAFNKFSKDVIEPLINNAQAAGNSMHFLQTDSWEMGNVGWTNNFAADFKKFRGYDIFLYLPVLAGHVVGSVEESDRFLYDYRQTIGDCIATYHYQLFADLAHTHGMGIHPESGGPHSAPVDALKVMAISDFPQGEFWAMANAHRVSDAERLSVKQSACVAHTNGKRFVAAEGPTSIGSQWEEAPKDLKSNIDRVFCSGVNRIVWHTFTSSPKEFGSPGNEYFAGTHLNPNVTWWKHADDFIAYLNRCTYMLSQGLFSADVLYYYGNDVPNFVFLKEDVKDLAFGHDWDKCSKDAIINRMSVKDHKIIFPDGMSYKVLVLPQETAIDLTVLRKIESLVKQGLIIIGPRPFTATGLDHYPQSDKEIESIASAMWGLIDGVNKTENNYGKGKVIFGKDINTVLDELKIGPDFAFTSTKANTALDYIHRTGERTDIYFVVNRFARTGIEDFKYRYLTTLPDRYEQVECKFRVSGKIPEIWDPMTGTTQEVLTYREENGYTILPLRLEPDGSRFIIFREAKQAAHIVGIEKDGKSFFPGNQFKADSGKYIELQKEGNSTLATIFKPGKYRMTWSNQHVSTIIAQHPLKTALISGEWDIHFDTTWGGPNIIHTDTLKSWTAFKEEGVRYYSGSAVYTKKITVNAGDLHKTRVILDLGNVLEMAFVKVNGHTMRLGWAAPFQFDITKYVKPGNNQLEVEVTNLWPNRLIGDGKLPAAKRLTKTNIVKFDGPNADDFLRKSGLLGPVKLMFVQQVSDAIK